MLTTTLAGCGQGAATGTGSTAAVSSPAVASTARSTQTRAAHRRSHRKAKRSSPVRLVYSTASGQVVQPQPAAGSCHALGQGRHSRPDPRCTPGALNPAVTQTTIGRTICMPGWTETVRPPESVTETEKAQSLAAYGDTGSMHDYEYDHFIPLELGGAVNDPRNLWPEPGASPNPKDSVEDTLRREVCDGQITLTHAQHAIASNWIKLAGASSAAGSGTSTHRPPAPASARGHCSLSASYSSHYNNYNVYVHSNQPDHTVTVTDSSGRQASWHTDSTGYADVYFKAPASAAGETVTVHVGTAACQGQL